jgi:hypothetical protein
MNDLSVQLPLSWGLLTKSQHIAARSLAKSLQCMVIYGSKYDIIRYIVTNRGQQHSYKLNHVVIFTASLYLNPCELHYSNFQHMRYSDIVRDYALPSTAVGLFDG